MRRYGDPIEVGSRGRVPVRFRWRGRVYLVRVVLAHWIERGSWWTGPGPGTSGGPSVPRSVAGALGAVEREVWRVEATAGPVVGVYDLVRDLPVLDADLPDPEIADPEDPDRSQPRPAARWRLARSLD